MLLRSESPLRLSGEITSAPIELPKTKLPIEKVTFSPARYTNSPCELVYPVSVLVEYFKPSTGESINLPDNT